MNRRALIGGLLALAAPAVIRTPGLLMPVRAIPDTRSLADRIFDAMRADRKLKSELDEIFARSVIYGEPHIEVGDKHGILRDSSRSRSDPLAHLNNRNPFIGLVRDYYA